MNFWLKAARFCCRRLANADDPAKFLALRLLGNELVPTYKFKWPQMAWWSDRSFNAYLQRFDEHEGMNSDRRFMLHELLRLVETVPGDTAECGVYSGASSFVICQANSAASGNKQHHMFDSFEGVSRPTDKDGDHWTEGDLAYDLNRAKQNLAEFEATHFYRGWIPDRFEDVANRKFSFVHIDVDLYEPTRESIAFFYSRMSNGGVVLIDDYGFTSCPGATQAVDDFLKDQPEQIVRLSGGGGFLVKGVAANRASRAAA